MFVVKYNKRDFKMSLENIKIENTRNERDCSQNMFPFAITINNPEPLLRAYLITVTQNSQYDSEKQSLAKKSGVILDQNTKNIIRLTFKNDPAKLIEFIQHDFSDWTARQKRFGLDEGIIRVVNNQFTTDKKEEKVTKIRKNAP